MTTSNISVGDVAGSETLDEVAAREVRQFFALHDALWSERDFDRLSQLWDEQDENLSYIGDEYWGPIDGWDALRAHLGRLSSRIDQAHLLSTVRSVRSVAPAVQLAVVLVDWTFHVVESPEPHTGSAWVTALLRRREGEWRMFHYMEASVYVTEEMRSTLSS